MILKHFTFLTLMASAILLDSAHAGGGKSGKSLKPEESIAAALDSEHQEGNFKPKFSISSEYGDGAIGDTFDIDVVEAYQAVTPDTVVTDLDGRKRPVGTLGYTLLVNDLSSDPDTIALLAVDRDTEEVQGIVQRKGSKAKKIKQGKAQKSTALDAEEYLPPAWACEVANHHHSDGGLFGRNLETDDHHHHEGHDHDHSRHHHHEHEKDEDIVSSINSMGKALRGSQVQMGKRRKLQSSGSYSYQVDLFIEIDTAFVNENGGLDGAVDYVNAIFTAANTVYEHEVDTHLNVKEISYATIYDGAGNAGDALDIMFDTYGSNNWHTDVDLHHALMGKSVGGGVAYLGVVCNSNYGYGVSGSMNGNFVDINQAMVWDMSVVMHEIGHNFNSDHTHDTDGYNPPVDTCGNSCPANVPVGSATIMSYCHLCSNGEANLLYTFGGDFVGGGSDRSNLNDWQNNPNLVGNVSYEAKRVPKTMWDHVSSRGSCVDVTDPPPPTPTQSPTPPAPTVSPTTAAVSSKNGITLHLAQIDLTVSLFTRFYSFLSQPRLQ
jgi:hypothetical protein